MATAKVEPLDMKLEVVVLGVSDVDRAKAFYEKLGWRLDADFAAGDDWRVVQLTPHNSDASIIFGNGIASAKPGLAEEGPGNLRQFIDVAVPAAQEVRQYLRRQVLDRLLLGGGPDLVGHAAILDKGHVPKPQLAGRSDEPAATVAK